MLKIWMLLLIVGLVFAQSAEDAFRTSAFLFTKGNLAAAELELRQAVAKFPHDRSLVLLLERVLEIQEEESSQNKKSEGGQGQDDDQDDDQNQEEQTDTQEPPSDDDGDDDEQHSESEEEPELNQPEATELDSTEVDSTAMDELEAMEILKNFTDSLILPPNPAGRRSAPERAW